jgi:hypothetical protein
MSVKERYRGEGVSGTKKTSTFRVLLGLRRCQMHSNLTKNLFVVFLDCFYQGIFKTNEGRAVYCFCTLLPEMLARAKAALTILLT